MAPALVLAVWVGLNLVLTVVLVGLGLLRHRTQRWTAGDEWRLEQWAHSDAISD
jgi:hypothetical protein